MDTQSRLPLLRIDRYLDILAQHVMREERPPMRWRVSSDEWYRLEAIVRDFYGWHAVGVDHSMLYGWPIESDDTLPANSVIFEPEPDGYLPR